MADANFRLIPRFSADQVKTALKYTPIVMINGPRQCGETTLARDLIEDGRGYITLDDDMLALVEN